MPIVIGVCLLLAGWPAAGQSLDYRPAGISHTSHPAPVLLAAAVTPGSKPTISAFRAAPAKIVAGQTSTLTWTVTGANTLSIDSGVGGVSGTSVKVSPQAAATYTLTATNSYGSSTATVTVTAGSLPAIGSFTASAAKVTAGQPSTLSWSVTGATTLTLAPGFGNLAVSATSATVKPLTTTTYVLTATNMFGSATAAVLVTAGSAPTISKFAASPAYLIAGQSSTLAWTVTGSPTLSLSPAVGAVTGSSLKVTPSATTVYTLTATNSFGSATASVTIALGSPPTIDSFTASPGIGPPGQANTLSWSVSGSPTLTLMPGFGPVTGTSVAVKPMVSTSYTLTAKNNFGAVTSTVTVAVGNLPAITSFFATPANVVSGQTSTLSWKVTGSPTLSISPNVGTVTGSTATVTATAITVYTLSATNSFGTSTASVKVTVGSAPTIASFTATPASVSAGQYSSLAWATSGASSVSLSPSGTLSATSATVKPQATTTYTLTARNNFGSTTATVTVAVAAGSPPTIPSFTATPSTVTAGQSSTLAWTVTGSPTLTLTPGIGTVTGNSARVTPSAATAYTLTARNSFGSASSTVTVGVTSGTSPAGPPTISSFFANPSTAGPAVPATLHWATAGASSLSIDRGVGTVTGTSVNVNPTAPTTYTLTATNGAGSVTATVSVSYIPLVSIGGQVYYSEHCLFIVPPASQVTWTGTNSWGSVYSTANVNSYVTTLKSVFPKDYFFVVLAANNLTPNSVPSVQPLRRTADGIGLGSTGVGVPSICRYNLGGGAVIDGAFGVLDHEIGHNWGIFLQPQLSDANGHWFSNSTAKGQMAGVYSDDGYVTDKLISGDPVSGFTWAGVDNIALNESQTFSPQDLYLQGFAATFPDVYVLTSPVYNADNSVSYVSYSKYDMAYMVKTYGARNPTYRNSPKRLPMAFVYIARNLAEIQSVYQPIERSINHFVNAEQIDNGNFRFQVPFLVDTQYRATVDALLADLDGNQRPTLTLPGPTALVSSDGNATVPFTASDPDGPEPTVSCVPASANCSIVGGNVVLTGLTSGSHFFTIKAEDAAGKKDFAHFVVDVP